jgi:hypothetical protein
MRAGRVAIGVAAAIVGHLLTLGAGVGFLAANSGSSDALALAIAVLLGGQLLVFVACMAVGSVQLTRGDRGIGLGLIVGWAVGVIVLPVLGFGVCVAAVSVVNGG